MATIPVPAGECVGIDVESHGRIVGRYDARNGYVDVANKSHADLIERTFGSKKQLGFHRRPRSVKTCPCGQLNFAVNQTCPACGADISSLEVVHEPS